MKKSDIHIGDKFHFLRMGNKAGHLSGEVVKIHDDPAQCVDMKVDGTDRIETAHVDDLTRGDNKQSKDRLSVGDRVKFRRMANKAIEVHGKIVTIHGANVPCVDVECEGPHPWIETAHVDDVVVLEPAAAAEKAAAEKPQTQQS